jgi:hypothetical protein
VAHQVLDRNRAIGGNQLQLALCADSVVGGDLWLRQCWNVLADGLIERDLAILEENHRRDGGDRLAHGVDAEDRVLRHRRLRLRIDKADVFEIGDLAVAGDEQHGAGDFALGGVGAQHLRDFPEPLAGEADLLGLARRQTIGVRPTAEREPPQRTDEYDGAVHSHAEISSHLGQAARIGRTMRQLNAHPCCNFAQVVSANSFGS